LPAHDYQGRLRSTLGEERRGNPWLAITDRAEFVAKLTANPPPRPANMDDLLRLNREGVEIPASVPAAEAVRLVGAGGAGSVIDVRTGAEFEAEHIPGSRHIPLDQIASRADEVRAAAAPRLVLCRTGNRAALARRTLEGLHVAGLSVIAGGMEAYVASGGKTARGRARVSLERQVRIAAGSLVVTGVLLGFLVHAAFFALSGFIGAGLVFAGVTDWCGLGLVLARMPWNRARSAAGAPAGGTCAAAPPAACAAGAPPPPAVCAAAPPPKEKPGPG
jgi:rhodanese-related sulfurtransferase